MVRTQFFNFFFFFVHTDKNVENLSKEMKHLPRRSEYRSQLKLKDQEIDDLKRELKSKENLLAEFKSKYEKSQTHIRVLKFRKDEKEEKLKGLYKLNGLTQYAQML